MQGPDNEFDFENRVMKPVGKVVRPNATSLVANSMLCIKMCETMPYQVLTPAVLPGTDQWHAQADEDQDLFIAIEL